MQVKRERLHIAYYTSGNSLLLEIIYISFVYHNYRMSDFFFSYLDACLLKMQLNMMRVGYYLNEVATCLLPQGPGYIKPALMSAHLSRSLTNPLRVHLRVLHGTHLALS